MSTVKSKKLQVGTDATASNNFTIYQPATPDGTLRIGVGNADSPTEVGRFDSNGYVATNAPAFSAYLSSNQSTGNSVTAKVLYDTVNFDTTSDYDNTTNYRYTPSVAGYYLFVARLRYDTNTSGVRRLGFFKNGVEEARVVRYDAASNGTFSASGSALVYMNGTTDYMEAHASQDSGGALDLVGTNLGNTFDGFLVRAV